MQRLSFPPKTDVTSSSLTRKMFPFCVSLRRLLKHVALMHNASYSKDNSIEQANNKHLYCSQKPISVLLIIIIIFLIIALNVPFVQIQAWRF